MSQDDKLFSYMQQFNDETRRELLRSDLEESAFTEQERQNVAQEILHTIGSLLDQADHALEGIEKEDMLGSAIVRASQSLADGIGNLANQIDQQTDTERRALAKACLEDVQQHLLLEEEGSAEGTPSGRARSLQARTSSEELSNMSEDDVMNVIQVAADLLRDVEETLRAIDQDEADEIADVALTVAHLFVASLQSIHSTVSPEDLLPQQQSRSATMTIEILSDEGEEDDPKTRTSSTSTAKNQKKKKKSDRLRVLWPPLGPAVAAAFDWGKDVATKQPLLAVALGITLWPVATLTAFVGAPLVVADGFVQDLYNNFEDAPIIHGIERTAAQLYQSGRLTFICGKLVGRQSLRVIGRQVKRHGGVGRIAQNVGDVTVDRITHPIETIGMAWNSLAWGAEALRDALGNFNDQERDAAVQKLQQ
jgi:hypothetical protein